MKINFIKENPLIDLKALRAKFPASCNLKKCKGRCCRDGVGIDTEEMKIILSNKELFIPLLEKHKRNPSLWFEEQSDDSDFPSGTSVDTTVKDGGCIFLEKSSGCVLETVALRAGLHRWTYKPFYCILYPLVYINGRLTLDRWHSKLWCQHSGNKNSIILYTCREELVYMFGLDFYNTLVDKLKSPRFRVKGINYARH
jgi:hypothetical protein